MSEAATPTPELLFRPDAFFLKPWRGWGVMGGLRGRSVLRYPAAGEGQGQAMSRGAGAWERASGPWSLTQPSAPVLAGYSASCGRGAEPAGRLKPRFAPFG
jgi:hypothetical protein